MAAKKITPNKLTAEIDKILSDYGDSVADNMTAAVKRVALSGAKALRAESRAKFPKSTGRYAKGWKSQTDTKKRTAQAKIYNKDLPGLPHLLEHGHANRGGGRTPGRIHIKPIEQEIIKSFEKEVRVAL